ncbi:tyrosine-type recombinase/integrase [Simplicispira metamorpha]|uniref:Integrase n=1 Tax=Simplicispira metamorpha TaxID=80881 RepID=A0A4R2N5V8_9BURK|nr:integrase arm-type DNA-binding domain-containing protein [Simplicispira metamorpha]TCP16195.1 integrase [Simplicispira metamorpha]
MLTDTDCKNATCPPDRKRARLTDAGGLYLETSPNGSKRWFAKLYANGKETRLALGSYPAVSLKEARMARDAAKQQKASGINPVQARKVEKLKAIIPGTDTFEATAREWIELHRPRWSDAHHARELRNLEKDLLPYIGSRPVREIEPVELLAVVRRVEDRGALVAASRVLSTARSVFLYAVATARASREITGDLKRALKPHTKKNLPAIVTPAELAGLLRASDGYKGGPVVRAALAMAPILFQRPGNLRTMRWQDVDLQARLWHIPSEDMKRTKEGKINGQPHVVPLPTQAVAILKALHHLTGGGTYVFPGLRNPKAPMSEAGVSAALNAMGYKDVHTWHGYRATGRTLIRQVLKYQKDVIEAQLAHVGQITHGGAYDRATHLEERTVMVQEWADYLDKLRTGADIIPLVQKAA